MSDVCGGVMSPTSGIYWVDLGFINNYKEPQLWLVFLRYSAMWLALFLGSLQKQDTYIKVTNTNFSSNWFSIHSTSWNDTPLKNLAEWCILHTMGLILHLRFLFYFILLYIYFECLFQKKILIFLENFGMPRIMVKGKNIISYYFRLCDLYIL